MSDDDDDMDDDDDEDDDDLNDELPPEIHRELSYRDDDEEDWEASEGADDADLGEMLPADGEAIIDHVNRVIAGEAELAEEMMEDRDDGFIEDPEEDDDEEDEEEELLEEGEDQVPQDEDGVGGEDDDDEEGGNIPWEWSDEFGDAPLMTRARGHAHGGPAGGGWYAVGGPRDIIRKSPFCFLFRWMMRIEANRYGSNSHWRLSTE